MNQERAKRISACITKLEEISTEIEAIRDEEQEAFDNLPNSLQESERGQKIQAAADELNQAYDETDGAVQTLANIEM